MILSVFSNTWLSELADQECLIVKRSIAGNDETVVTVSANSWPSDWSHSLKTIFITRGLKSHEDLNYSLKKLLRPTTLKGLDAAVARMQQAVREQEHVVIVGDFDADGATSSALAVLALRAMGLHNIHYLVPNRFEYGYGLTPEIVAVCHEQFKPDLIVTVDNGIASIDGVDAANQLGINVVITDHHLPGNTVPEAIAIVNPNQQGCKFESGALAGVGVVFYVLSALRSTLRESGWFSEQGLQAPNMAQYLDLVALGTVADVVPLDENNRILVYQGLERIRHGLARPGIYALLQVAGKDFKKITSSDLGFIVGPRLNAAGRLDDMSCGIECLLTDNENQALALASELNDLNQQRRAIERSMEQEALSLLSAIDKQEASEQQWGLCLFEPSWHQGVIGILAGRIKERYHRPVIAFAETSDDEIKGSARSIEGLHIRDTLDCIATQHPELLQKFGGHAMAAGLTLKKEHFERFAKIFDQTVRTLIDPNVLTKQWLTDGELDDSELTLEFAEILKASGPWGQQFPEPLFSGHFKVANSRVVGEKHLKLTLFTQDPSQLIDAIAFNVETALLTSELDQIELIYQLEINDFRGQVSPQLLIRHFVS